MKILNVSQIQQADLHTIQNEPISSINLMERASQSFVKKFIALIPIPIPVYIFCGTGNNGGDGLAIGRILSQKGWKISVFICSDIQKGSEEFKINLERIDSYSSIFTSNDFPNIPNNSMVIDGLFGTGLSRKITGLYAQLIDFLNKLSVQRFAIDTPSGLLIDQHTPSSHTVFQAHQTLSFQLPKIAFFMPENYKYVGQWHIIDIGLAPSFIHQQNTDFYYTKGNEVSHLIPERKLFTHKTAVGQLMIVGGSIGMVGAAALCAKAALKTGVGIVKVHLPTCGVSIVQTLVPEAMVIPDKEKNYISNFSSSDIPTVAIGPGLSTSLKTSNALQHFFENHSHPLILDADALNIISQRKNLLNKLAKDTILTPHPGEFKKLVGEWKNDFHKIELLRTFCKKFHINVVLKGAYSAVCNKEGKVFFNSSGSPSLATAGSGDVLTGIIGALVAQHLSPFDALQLSVYLHGLAGELMVKKNPFGNVASNIITFIPKAMELIKVIKE